MLKTATAKEMQEIDRVTIEKYGIAGTVLMERAGLAVVSRINELFFRNTDRRKVVVLAGSGNNGGDGFVIARILHNQGKDVEVYLTTGQENLKGDAKVNYIAAKKFGVKMYPARKFPGSRFPNTVIVDALLGTGLSKDVRAPLSDLIEKAGKLSSPVVSVDIPSGIASDTGQIMGCAVKAQYTVTFGLPKRGHLLYPGADYTGQLFIEDIGFPRKLLDSGKIKINLIEKSDMASLMPARPEYSHKGTYGHVLIVAGSKGKTGAALMAAKACLRSGTGLVTIGIPESLVNAFQSRVTEEMILPLPDKGDGTLSFKSADKILGFLNKKADVLAIGPGLSVDDEISELVSLLITESGVPAVIDADGLNAIANRTGILKKGRSPVILTPHPGEMLRLSGRRRGIGAGANNVDRDRINTAVSFAKEMKTYLVLKGVPTVTATPDGKAFINSTGNPGMATAGMGDVLTGMIASLLAQRLNPQNASILGVYIHGLIGDAVAGRKGRRSLIASDIIRAMPGAFKTWEQL